MCEKQPVTFDVTSYGYVSFHDGRMVVSVSC